MATMMLAAVITANLSTITDNCPHYFFGAPITAIKTEGDALSAIRNFCEIAPVDVISKTAEELKVLSEVNNEFYSLINSLLWKVNLPLGTTAWWNHHQLLNCGLK